MPLFLARLSCCSFIFLTVSLFPAGKVPAAEANPLILTPAPSATPRINGAKVFGVRPGSPFLYSIPATGDRPMFFSAEGLPEGLKIDPSTGRITGAVAKAGEYPVKLRAKNSKGTTERIFKIVAGETIALTPPMGWNSWNCWGDQVDQEKVLASARALAASGLNQHGWTYINIDDAWQGQRGGPDKAIQPDPKKFPDLKSLCNEIHGMGLKVGIYSTPWVSSYAKRIGGSSEDPDGTWTKSIFHKIGQYSFAENDARQWAAWGLDYLKYDWNPNEFPETAQMEKGLRQSGRDIIFSLSNSTPYKNIGQLSKMANCWRTTGDIVDTWQSMSNRGFNQGQWKPFQSPGHYNDPDMLVVGEVGWGKPHPTRLTPDEQYTHISLWCLLSAPLLLGNDLAKLDDFTIGLLSNDEVLDINQDSLCQQAVQVAGDGNFKVYAKILEDGSWAVGLFNLTETPAPVTLKWPDLKLQGPQAVRDLWRQKDLGVFDQQFSTTVPAHGVVLLRLLPEK